MRITRIYNNNIVSTSVNNKEMILIGKGLGFNQIVGNQIDEKRIEKQFIAHDDTSNLVNLLRRVPPYYLEITQKVLDVANNTIDMRIDNNLITSLADTIYLANERVKNHVYIPNLVLEEIQTLYKSEYQIAQEALNIIYEYTERKLPNDEAGNITILLLSAKIDDKKTQPMKILQFTKDIMEIIQSKIGIKKDANNLNYARLSIHLKFLAKSIFTKSKVHKATNQYQDLFKIMKLEQTKYIPCLAAIYDYVEKTYHYQLSVDEQLYILLHISKAENE